VPREESKVSIRVVDVDLDNLHLCPKPCLGSVFWEMPEPEAEMDPAFHKEEWFSSTLLEWGRCGKLLLEDDEGLGFAQYGPATFFAGLAKFPWARISDDAVFLSSCFVQEGHRGRGYGAELVRTVARDVVDRGYRALESVGDRSGTKEWVMPGGFLARCRFTVLREHRQFPVMRLDTLASGGVPVASAAVAVPLSPAG
jgi:GNAT superfamily N-acetyltransferase